VTAHWLVAAACLVAAAVVLSWPRRGRQARLLTPARPAAGGLQARVESLSGRRAMILAVALAALAGTLLAGPVAGVVAGAYGGITVRAVLRRRASRAAAAMRTRSLDALCGLAADLRAGLSAAGAARAGSQLGRAAPLGRSGSVGGSTPVAGQLAGSAPPAGASPLGVSADLVAGPEGIEDRRMAQLTEAAWRLAERTGAPIADLVERIEADARAMDRASAAAAAQAAGARATAWLLAGLPVGGIALGYSIGADPLEVLLHTPIGAACAVGAIALQVAGLAWADRLASIGTTRPEPASQEKPAPALMPTATRAPAPGQISTPTQASTPPPAPAIPVATSPLRTAAMETTAWPRAAAPSRVDSSRAARAAGRPTPRPRPRAAASRSGAAGVDGPTSGSDA
jgi:tight adherence protein B